MNRFTISREEAHDLSRFRWLLVIIGLLSAAAGVILVIRPSDSLKTLAVVVGIFVLIDGIAELVSSIQDRENRTLRVIAGLLGVIIGILLIRHPVQGVNAIGLLIGIWLVAAGGIRFVDAIVVGVRPLLRSLLAWLEIVAGIVIVSNPHIGYTALAIITGIWLIANGIGMIVLAAAIRSSEREAASLHTHNP